MKDIETVVSDNIQKILREYNINQTDLAKIADVSVSTVGKWVLKKATPRMGSVQKISDYFNLPKSYILKEEQVKYITSTSYKYLPTAISAGLPFDIDGITETTTISISDDLMGRYAGHNDILISRIFGDSMDKIMPDGSIIAIKPIAKESLSDGDIVVFSLNGEYAVKQYLKRDNKLIFRPLSKGG